MSFITVKFGDDKQALFNPNCSAINLLDDIKRRCNCPKEVVIDLSDEDGVIQKLSDKYDQNASCILKYRGEFILLKVDKGPNQPSIYSPLLNGLERSNPDLLAKLQSVSKPEEELPKVTLHSRKKSPWERANVKKVTGRAKEPSNVGMGRTSNESGRESQLKTDEKYGCGVTGEKKTSRQRKQTIKT